MDAAALSRVYGGWLQEMLPSGQYRAWVAEASAGGIVAGGGILVLPWPPGPQSLAGKSLAFVYNIYTEPAHRKRGLSHHSGRTGQVRHPGLISSNMITELCITTELPHAYSV